jgi:hypothetical protein
MLPGPPIASPPETDQIIGAAFPLENVTVNCSTDLPLESIELQPVQLVSIVFIPIGRASMEFVPDEIENTAFVGVALTSP